MASRSSGALAGVRVLDLTRLLPGGYCTMLPADLGADVVKVEDTERGDYVRWAPPFHQGVEPSAASAPFAALNRGKRSACLGLKSEGGRGVLLRLVDGAEVLVESFRPGCWNGLPLPALRNAGASGGPSGPGPRRAHRGGAARGGLTEGEVGELLRSGAAAGPRPVAPGAIEELRL